MRKIVLKKLRYDELQVIKTYLEAGITNTKADFNKPEKSTVMAVIAELYVKITKKLLFVDKSKMQSISLTTSESMAFVAYTTYFTVVNEHSTATILSFKQTVLKQLQ